MSESQSEKSQLVKDLEGVFTIDGRGRPRKCQLFLELVSINGMDAVLSEMEKIAKRTNF